MRTAYAVGYGSGNIAPRNIAPRNVNVLIPSASARARPSLTESYALLGGGTDHPHGGEAELFLR